MMNRNRQRGDIFRLAYKRANRAIKAGFYLETIAICDSLMTDRLREILRSNIDFKVTKLTIGQCLAHLQTHKVNFFDQELHQACKNWSLSRNKFMHSLGQLGDFDQVPWLKRLRQARNVALDGLHLVNRLSKEARRHKI